MVQESIVDYINAQMKVGVSRDAIKTTLTGAGWQAVDVEDTLKKIEAAKTVQPISSVVATSRLITPMGGTTSAEPQTIKVSDLISTSPASTVSATPAAAAMPAARSTGPKSPLTGPAPATTSNISSMPAGIKSADTFQATSYPGMKTRSSHGALITEIILAIVIIAVGAFAGFLYVQNSSLKGQLSTLNGQSSGVNSQLSALQAQVVASTTALTAQVVLLNSETQELQTELAFYAVPSGVPAGATSTATINGIVSGGGKSPYAITAMYGAKVYVANSKTASVIAALAPLMATASTTATSAQFSGTYVAGSDSITLTAVNGSALQ